MKYLSLPTCGALIMAALLFAGCSSPTSDNKGLDYESIDVNFEASMSADSLSAESVVGVFATCTRGEETNLAMSRNTPAQFVPLSSGMTVNLVRKTEDDNILASAGDHNFLFTAFTPFSAYDGDQTKLNASIPSIVSYGNTRPALQVAKAKKSSVVAPVELSFSGAACRMVMNVPGNIFGTEESPTLASIQLKAYDEAKFSGYLAFDASYDLSSDRLNIDESSLSKSITVDFGANGLPLEVGYNEVAFDIAPFTVPSGAFIAEVKDINGTVVESEVLLSDEGKDFKAGETIELNLTRPGEDGIIPCTSPVEWPVGYNEDDTPRMLKGDYVDMWPTNGVGKGVAKDSHIWKNVAQSQASATWIVSSDNPNPSNIGYEINNILNNSGVRANYASPCVKGIWTGDGLEFSIPVKNIRAGTVVTLTLPAFGRGAPIFWNVEYLDGGEWKCNKTLQQSPDGQFEMECTWVIPHGNVDSLWGGHIRTHSFTLTNEIRSGYIKIRFICASGEYTTAATSAVGNNSCYRINACEYSNSRLFAFVNSSDECKAVSVSWEQPSE